MKKFLCMLLTAVLAGCTNESPVNPEPEPCPVETVADAGLLIDPQSRTLDSSDAAKVAMLFQKRATGASSRTVGGSSSPIVTTITDETSGNPLLYIVNHGDNGGFAIVSASKMTEPLLAYSESGNFEVNTSSASSELLEGMKDEVRNAIAHPSDSLKRRYAFSWAMFESPVGETYISQSRAGSADVNQMIATKIAKMEAKGYKYAGKLSWAQSHLTASEYEALCRDISSHCDPQYDYKETSLCFTKDGYDVSIGPMLKTHWHQNYPFNIAIDMTYGVAGCGPIAIAQICYYHKYPTKYNWNTIPLNPVTTCDALTALMTDITRYSNPTIVLRDPDKRTKASTGISIDNAKNTFDKMGYSKSVISSVSVNSMKSAITIGKPFYMQGYNGGSGHAWVCDGYQKQLKTAIVSFLPQAGIILDQDPGDPYFDYQIKYVGDNPSFSAGASYTDVFHMNLGWNGQSDGWYMFNSYGGSVAGYNTNFQMLVPTKP